MLAGRLEGCRFNGCNPSADEIATIEANWHRDIRVRLGSADTVPPFEDVAPTTDRCRRQFYEQHASEILAEQQAEHEAWHG